MTTRQGVELSTFELLEGSGEECPPKESRVLLAEEEAWILDGLYLNDSEADSLQGLVQKNISDQTLLA